MGDNSPEKGENKVMFKVGRKAADSFYNILIHGNVFGSTLFRNFLRQPDKFSFPVDRGSFEGSDLPFPHSSVISCN